MKGNEVQAKRVRMGSIALSVCFLLFSACTAKTVLDNSDKPQGGSADSSQGHSAAEVAQALLPQKLIKVGFVQAGHESDRRIAATKSCKEAFSEEKGYDLYFVDADNDPKAQVDAVRNFIEEQVGYIVIDPILATGWTAALKEAYHADIPVILLNQMVDCDKRYYTAWFGPDFVREGEWAGQWLQDYLNSQGRGTQQVNLVAINGTQGSPAQSGRTEGFARYLELNGNWELLAQECGDFTESGGRMVMERYLEKYAGIDVVICQNDSEAVGACAALDEAGVSYGKDGDMILISFDATRKGLKAVLAGKINADFECSPLSPPYAAGAIRRLEAGEILAKKDYYLPQNCFTADEDPMTLRIDFEGKRMVTVTREFLKEREY